ncbi:hypothetical protein AAHA92_05298 [Salvia divinorum]|uniref:Uncharacterized protein n=1 Tax=Salvia divinorum TaxID=28513 RepID=A0ABD1I1Z0_SALDI
MSDGTRSAKIDAIVAKLQGDVAAQSTTLNSLQSTVVVQQTTMSDMKQQLEEVSFKLTSQTQLITGKHLSNSDNKSNTGSRGPGSSLTGSRPPPTYDGDSDGEAFPFKPKPARVELTKPTSLNHAISLARLQEAKLAESRKLLLKGLNYSDKRQMSSGLLPTPPKPQIFTAPTTPTLPTRRLTQIEVQKCREQVGDEGTSVLQPPHPPPLTPFVDDSAQINPTPPLTPPPESSTIFFNALSGLIRNVPILVQGTTITTSLCCLYMVLMWYFVWLG